MTKSQKKGVWISLLFSFLFGAVFTWITSTILLTEEYGRMSNHKHCNLSKDNLKTLDGAERDYYISTIKYEDKTY